MTDAPEKLWIGPNEWVDWGVLVLGEEVFWETPENSAPDDRDGLTKYIRDDLKHETNEDNREALERVTAERDMLVGVLETLIDEVEDSGTWVALTDSMEKARAALAETGEKDDLRGSRNDE